MTADPTTDGVRQWPAHLRTGAVRFARASSNYESTVAFYRDLVGLPVLGVFVASFGTDGTIFGLPDTSVQLEIVRVRDDGQSRNGGGSDQLVLYLDGPAALPAAVFALRAAGLLPDPEPHPYWAANGAVTYRDPDGRAVVFAPWVFGRDPEPVDREADRTAPGAVQIDWYDGDREAIRPLFAEAEDSRVQLDSYLHSGRVLVARDGTDIVGHLQLLPTEREREVELKNMAVEATRRGTGIGRALVDVALRRSAATGHSRMVVSTAAADVDNLRFYQRRGFRFIRVERDAFGHGSGYPDPIVIDGIPLRDRLWLAQELTSAGEPYEPETGETTTSPGELRVVITVPDHDTAVDFYRDAFGLRELAAFTDDNGGQATLLDAGRATVEIGDELHADAIDALEVGRRVAGQIRLAFAVQDATDATDRLLAGGGKLIAPATTTPWGSVNARFESPDRLQLTVFSNEVTED